MPARLIGARNRDTRHQKKEVSNNFKLSFQEAIVWTTMSSPSQRTRRGCGRPTTKRSIVTKTASHSRSYSRPSSFLSQSWSLPRSASWPRPATRARVGIMTTPKVGSPKIRVAAAPKTHEPRGVRLVLERLFSWQRYVGRIRPFLFSIKSFNELGVLVKQYIEREWLTDALALSCNPCVISPKTGQFSRQF